MKYELDRLGATKFEEMIQSLIQGIAGVQKVQVFGKGPDGQREATIQNGDHHIITRKDEFAEKFPREVYTHGYTIVQAKYKSPEGKEEDWKWLRRNLKDELERFREKDETQWPQSYLFFTNIVLTPVLNSGIIDKVNQFVSSYQDMIPEIHVLGQDDIRAMLDNNPNVVDSYTEFITPSHVLAELIKQRNSMKSANIMTSELFNSLWETSHNRRKQFAKTKIKKIYKELIAGVEVAPLDERKDRKEYTDLSKAVYDVTNHYTEVAPIALSAKGGQGKSTQLMSLWAKLENHKNAEGQHDCVVFFFNLYALNAKTDLMNEILQKYDVSIDKINCIKKDLRSDPQKAGHHYFLVLDGLDEIKDTSPVLDRITKLGSIESGYQNLQIIVAGRISAGRLFPNQNITNMSLKDLEKRNVEKWLSKYHPNSCPAEEYDSIKGNPMLLTLAYEIEHDRKKDGAQYVNRRKGFPLSQGEVIWNYSEYILNKHCRKYKNGDKKTEFARWMMRDILPYIAYHHFYDGARNDMLQSELKRIMIHLGIKEEKGIEEVKKIIQETLSGIIHMDSVGHYVFEHRLFKDFFAMLYVSNLAEKLYNGKHLSPKEIKVLTDNRILENDEYYNLIICTLPFKFGCFGENYEQDFMETLNTYIDSYKNDKQYNSQRIQIVRFLRAMYSIWMADYYVMNKLCEGKYNSQMAWCSYNALTDVSLILKESENNIFLPRYCLVFVLYVLSQIFRVGSLFMHNVRDSKLEGFERDLNRSFEYIYKGITMNGQETDISDGYNYVSKVFFAAKEKLALHFHSGEKEYKIQKGDFLANIRDLSIFDYHFRDKISEEIASIQPGNTLSKEKADERIKCFDTIANDFLQKGDQNNCVFSINLLALADELVQESKPNEKRDYTFALSQYIKASFLGRAASQYSAKKAVQLLVEKKAGIDAGGNECIYSKADRENTISKVHQLMDIAALNRNAWGELYFLKGIFKRNYYCDKDNNQKLVRALTEAFEDYVFSLSQIKEKRIPLLLELIDTGLELTRINKCKSSYVQTEIKKAMAIYCDLLPDLVKKALGVHLKDKWAPSPYIVDDYFGKMKDYSIEYEQEISLLSLSQDMQKCLACIKEQESNDELIEFMKEIYL